MSIICEYVSSLVLITSFSMLPGNIRCSNLDESTVLVDLKALSYVSLGECVLAINDCDSKFSLIVIITFLSIIVLCAANCKRNGRLSRIDLNFLFYNFLVSCAVKNTKGYFYIFTVVCRCIYNNGILVNCFHFCRIFILVKFNSLARNVIQGDPILNQGNTREVTLIFCFNCKCNIRVIITVLVCIIRSKSALGLCSINFNLQNGTGGNAINLMSHYCHFGISLINQLNLGNFSSLAYGYSLYVFATANYLTIFVVKNDTVFICCKGNSSIVFINIGHSIGANGILIIKQGLNIDNCFFGYCESCLNILCLGNVCNGELYRTILGLIHADVCTINLYGGYGISGIRSHSNLAGAIIIYGISTDRDRTVLGLTLGNSKYIRSKCNDNSVILICC